YSQNSKAYIVLNKHTKKVKESLNVTFDKTPPPSKTSPLVDDDLDEEQAIKVIEKKNLKNDIVDETLEIDKIVNIKESRNHPLENVIRNLNQRTLRSQAQNKSNFFFISTIEPKNVNEALGDESWIVAIQEELNQFVANDIWELVPQPKNMKIIGTKWVFRNKLDENGIVSRNKARLVAQGYNQQEGIDYDETYALVARLESIRILLAYAYALDFKLFQMDVKSAFLNGFINEEVYVAQPSGFIDFEKPDHVYKLNKALYGLGYPKETGIETMVYADSDHAGDYVDRKSTSGICTLVGCCLTYWFSKKQTALVISTTEVEYVSAGKACQQALCMKQALVDYDIRLDDITIMCDNKGQFVVNFVIQNKSFSLTFEEFGQVLKIPFKGQASFTEMWSLDHLSVSVLSRGLYKTKPPSPKVTKTLIQVPRQGQETRTKNKKTIVVAFDHCLSHDRAMHPLAPHYERKTRANQGKKRPRESNASSSSSTLNHPSSSHPLDDSIAKNDDESFHSNPSSLFQNISSSLNDVSRVHQHPPYESHYLYTFLSKTINLQTQQRDAHREWLRSIGQALKNMMG
nr:retrovirus-related Pol polyprotein from transposon TNT 1-94 [Tanacetum cinerariifolium]